MSRALISFCLAVLVLPACETGSRDDPAATPTATPAATPYSTPDFPPKIEVPPFPGMPDKPPPDPSPPADRVITREKVELVGYGVGPLGTKGRDRAIDRALRVIVQQASGMAFRYDGEGDQNYVQTSVEGHIQGYDIVKEVRAGDQQVIVVKGKTQVELPEHEALIRVSRTVTAPPKELDRKIGAATIEVVREVVQEHRSGQATVQGFVYMTGLFVDLAEGGKGIEVRIPFVVLLEE